MFKMCIMSIQDFGTFIVSPDTIDSIRHVETLTDEQIDEAIRNAYSGTDCECLLALPRTLKNIIYCDSHGG